MMLSKDGNLTKQVIAFALDLLDEQMPDGLSDEESRVYDIKLFSALVILRDEHSAYDGREIPSLEDMLQDLIERVVSEVSAKRQRHLELVRENEAKLSQAKHNSPRPSRMSLTDSPLCVPKRADKIISWRST